MLSKSEQKFTSIYAIIVIIELLCASITSLTSIRYFTKPLIVLSLLLFFLFRSQLITKNVRILTILALLCSLSGDIALLFDGISPNYFMLGLGSFLVAHVMYVLIFLKQRDPYKSPVRFTALMLCYAALLFYMMKDGLGNLLIPVIVYMIVILSMSTTAYLRQKQDHVMSYNWVFTGAILFMVSDSILALDKFFQPLALSSIFIMLTYALAQYCIVIGILKHNGNLR
ncbi:lysoplasmalogenase [Psychroserpens mesophilus]|uniref:lysoplasmalogenase n=1 Tax=Psychroserpens mesophilus TaxID=325473 RepID=UPI00058D1F58|nr:lysoplasmalogenase [Psychroserpens mesophilus]